MRTYGLDQLRTWSDPMKEQRNLEREKASKLAELFGEQYKPAGAVTVGGLSQIEVLSNLLNGEVLS